MTEQWSVQKSFEVMECVVVVVSLYLWLTSLESMFLLKETWLRVVTAQHLFSSDIRQTDGLLFPPKPAAWCPPPTSIRIGLTSALSPLTYMATRNGAKPPSEQPPGPSMNPCFPHSATQLYPFRITPIISHTLSRHAEYMLCWVWYHILDNIKRWHEYKIQIEWEAEQKRHRWIILYKIMEMQSLSRSWSRWAKADPANSNYSSIFFQKGKVWTAYWAIISQIPLYAFKASCRFETRHNNNDPCCHSKEGTSKNLIFSCPAALWLAAMVQSL